ncbi:helicase-associated domain-containing protein [Nocardia cyriacigeorgica]|uniref:helicase-associated domain-containing protein n=1 Tax=Nocardia cyriacigeorgica TaxID=135487 RepID=UPI0018956802|nr:helicase-associated domain-containing protein [Nocardia cyriacigeorgica]MBF6286034.1 helicase-associated domain-containing protein [Nocardia cyriacigeorgica]MBF6425911.1 helicase-associated domain-containing protein [Nocardia cyriacigeorgica]BDT84873.1 DNA-binding protein [Nocardia cyriacigeorgica]
MTGTDSLADWLGARSDAELVSLLELRPDLAVPLPSSMTVLAARAEQRASVLRAADELDTLEFAIVETLAVRAASAQPPLTRRELKKTLRDRVKAAPVDAALKRLTERALVWSDGDALRVVPAAAEALPWPMGSTTELPDGLTEPEVTAELAEISPTERALLDKLAATGPRGRTKDAAPGTPPDRPVQQLLSRRLLRPLDAETVELPLTVAQVLRGEPVTDPHALTPPTPATTSHAPDEVNAVCAGEVGELLRHCSSVLEVLGQVPAPALRAGGLGVRETRRIAKHAGTDEQRTGLLIELLAAAKLIDRGLPDPPPDIDTTDDFWAPTPAADSWLEAPPARRWVTLAQAWLESDRVPWMIGMRDANDKPLAALAHELRSPHAMRDRRAMLGVLAELPAGTALEPSGAARLQAWRAPRWRRHFRLEAVERTFGEATALGIIGRGALSAPGRALLGEQPDHAGAAEAAMEQALPDPVDHVLVQADLTVIAPGPLTADLQSRIELVADVESAGAATVYRIGETSVRRALDSGLTAAELHGLFARHSRTPIPQALTYLIDDVARRHGQLRAGMAQSFVRSDDPALLTQVLNAPVAAELALRAIAPTVAISQAPLGELLDRLRAAGFTPAGEDSAGMIVDLQRRGARIAVRPNARQAYRPVPPSTEQLELLVRELRAGERAAGARSTQSVRTDGTRTGTAATLALLQLAARGRRAVNIGYVDAAGTAIQRVVEPVRIGNGQLDALDPVTGAVRHFTLHRIASVALLE